MASSEILASPQVIIFSLDGIVEPDMSLRDRNFSQRHGFVALLKGDAAERLLAWE